MSLIGDLDPFLDFVARSSGSDITVFITVRGRVSELDISFSSQPELPQDEVLARLIFNRGINELSAFQIAQLAAAAAELAGGSNNSLLGSLRAATGLDDLDVVTDSEGNAAVRAGRYIQENVYLGIEAGEQGSTRGSINLDITEESEGKGFDRRGRRYGSRRLLSRRTIDGATRGEVIDKPIPDLAVSPCNALPRRCQAGSRSFRWHDRFARLALCEMPLMAQSRECGKILRNPPGATNFASSLSHSREPLPIQSCTFPFGVTIPIRFDIADWMRNCNRQKANNGSSS